MNFLQFGLNTSAAGAEGVVSPIKRDQHGKDTAQMKSSKWQSKFKKVLRGKASWYGPRFHGKKTANGDIFDQRKLTAAHKTLPLGSKAIVTNLKNGNSVEVEINDRGPYVSERIIDVSYAAAKQLGFDKSGTAPVQVELLQEGTG
jgi:rare lipoprotein A